MYKIAFKIAFRMIQNILCFASGYVNARSQGALAWSGGSQGIFNWFAASASGTMPPLQAIFWGSEALTIIDMGMTVSHQTGNTSHTGAPVGSHRRTSVDECPLSPQDQGAGFVCRTPDYERWSRILSPHGRVRCRQLRGRRS